jgi:hypothetical protein
LTGTGNWELSVLSRVSGVIKLGVGRSADAAGGIARATVSYRNGARTKISLVPVTNWV